LKKINIKRKMQRTFNNKDLTESEKEDINWLKSVSSISETDVQMIKKLAVLLLFDSMGLNPKKVLEVKTSYGYKESNKMVLCKRNINYLIEMYQLKEELDRRLAINQNGQ
jgi:hypothetical protein